MKFKLEPLEIPDDNPFKHDALNRKMAVDVVVSLIDEVEGPFVLAIDSPWGTGKTTFVRMVQKVLSSESTRCIYFSAWETDFASDPMIAFLGEIEKQIDESNNRDFSEHFQRAKTAATLLAKKAISIAAALATAGALNVDDFSETMLSEFASDTFKDAVNAFTDEKDLIKQFQQDLERAVKSLDDKNGDTKVVIFVDELDRCRPTYAIALLERIKHLFNVNNVQFVLSLDKLQLNVSLGAVYGQGINGNEYLRRFIDLEYTLPRRDSKNFASNFLQRSRMTFCFDEEEYSHDRDALIDMIAELSRLFSLSLRTQQQCVMRIQIAMTKNKGEYTVYPYLIVFFAFLREGAKDLYDKYLYQNFYVSQLMGDLRNSFPGMSSFFNTDAGITIEAYLTIIYIEPNHFIPSPQQLFEDYRHTDSKRGGKLITIIENFESPIDQYPRLLDIIKGLEMMPPTISSSLQRYDIEW